MADETTPYNPSDVETPEGFWSTSRGISVVSVVLAGILSLGMLFVGLRADPNDDANYIATALAVIIASLNVLFTLWLLRTAQRQLSTMRKQAIEQRTDSREQINQLKDSHEAERREAFHQLESLREQLDLARNSHAAERDEAIRALAVSEMTVDEALRARLDQSAPRVSLSIKDAQILLCQRQGDGTVSTTKMIPDYDIIDGVANCWLMLVFRFTLKNWGNEPVGVSMGSPWEKQENRLLFPDDPWTLEHAFRVASSSLRKVAEVGIRRNEQDSEWVFAIVASDLGGQVSDYHVWRIHPKPFGIEHGKVVQNPDWDRTYSKFATRERRYHNLDRRDLAAGKTLDGPRL